MLVSQSFVYYLCTQIFAAILNELLLNLLNIQVLFQDARKLGTLEQREVVGLVPVGKVVNEVWVAAQMLVPFNY